MLLRPASSREDAVSDAPAAGCRSATRSLWTKHGEPSHSEPRKLQHTARSCCLTPADKHPVAVFDALPCQATLAETVRL